MGYYTHYTDQINIYPPIKWSEVKDSPFVEKEDDRWGYVTKDVRFGITEERVDEDTVRKYADRIEPTQDDEYKGYDIVEHVQEIIDTYGKDRKFSGYINAEGEETGDLWRLYVRDGIAVAVKPEITWPEF